MIATKYPGSGTAEYENSTLVAEIRALVAEIERADAGHTTSVVPRYWALGGKLARFEGALKQKYALAKSRPRYYRARQIHKHFSSFAEARDCKQSLHDLLGAIRKGIRRRQAAPANVKAARALIKAENDKVEDALLFLVQRHWKVSAARAWLQEVEAQQQACERAGDAATGGEQVAASAIEYQYPAAEPPCSSRPAVMEVQ